MIIETLRKNREEAVSKMNREAYSNTPASNKPNISEPPNIRNRKYILNYKVNW